MVGQSLMRSAPADTEIFSTSRSELDLTRTLDLIEYFKYNRIEAVIMAAAKVGGIYANSNNQTTFLLENLKIQNSVFEAAIKNNIKNFIFLGSSCIYPKYARQPIDESQLMSGPLEPTNESYAIAKIVGLRFCRVIFEELGFNYFTLMPANLYGPGDNFDILNSHVPAALMRRFHEAKISKQKTVRVWGTGKPYREFMHVDDLSSACWHFMNQGVGGQLINIGTGQEMTIKDFSRKIAKIVGYTGNVEFDSSQPDGTPRKLLNIEKAKSLGWTPKISLTIGLENTYNWFTQQYEKGEIRGF